MWLEHVYYLIENGSVSLETLGYGYPSGFVFITSGSLLIWPDYLTVYFFMKIAAIFYLFLYIVISFVILKHLFKSKFLVFFSLLLLYLSNYFLSRNIINIASSFASILVLISFLLIVKDYPLYLQGFIIASLFLIHPLTFFFHSIVLSAYILFKIVSSIRNRKLDVKELFSIFFMLILALILFIPYFTNYPEDIGDLYNFYQNIVNDTRFQNQFNFDSMEFENNFFLFIPFLDFFNIFRDQQFYNRFYGLTTLTIGLFFIATILGLFISFLIRKKKLIIFSFSTILVLVSNFLPYFYSNLYVLDAFKYRTLEIFALPIIIMATFFFESVIKISKMIVNYLNLKFKSRNFKINRENPFFKLLRIENVFLLFLFANTTFMVITRDLPEYSYYYNDDYVNITLYLRENAESGSLICHPYFDRDDIQSVLYDMDFYHYNFSNTPILRTFFIDMRENRTNYLIINNSDISETWKRSPYYVIYFNNLIINLTQFSLWGIRL